MTQYVVDINHNDELPVVIRKCNENFRAIMSQRSKISQIEQKDAANAVANKIAIVVEDFTTAIEAEEQAREDEDTHLQNQIDDIIVSGGNDYDNLIHKPTITEVDLGVRQDNTFGPLGTTTTVTIEGDNNYDGRLMKVLTNADLQAIIDAVEAS